MTGTVIGDQATLFVSLQAPAGASWTHGFVVDTGFSGDLTLPAEMVAELGLPFVELTPSRLADDSSVLLPMYEATIVWDAEQRSAHVLATGERPLLGTGLLRGREFVAQFVENGLVTVEAI